MTSRRALRRLRRALRASAKAYSWAAPDFPAAASRPPVTVAGRPEPVQPLGAPVTALDAATARAVERVREIAANRPPADMEVARLADWYAEQLGALAWHAVTLADAVDPDGAAR